MVDFPEEHYDVGDTVTADIYIKSNDVGANFMTVDFTLAVPEGLTLSKLESALPAGTVSDKDGQYAYNINSTNPVTVTSEGVQIATATFTVDADEVGDSETVTLNLSNAEVTNQVAYDPPISGTVQEDTTTLHNIKVTLDPGEHATIDGADAALTLYAKYNESGLYSNEARTQEVESINLAANEGYRLADTQWSGNMANFTDIAEQIFTASQNYTVQTVKTWNITFVAGTNVTFVQNAETEVTVDDETPFSEVDTPEYTLPNHNYTFDGWRYSDDG